MDFDAAEARSRDVGEAGDEVPDREDYKQPESEDDFDQLSMQEQFRLTFEESGGETSMPEVILCSISLYSSSSAVAILTLLAAIHWENKGL